MLLHVFTKTVFVLHCLVGHLVRQVTNIHVSCMLLNIKDVTMLTDSQNLPMPIDSC